MKADLLQKMHEMGLTLEQAIELVRTWEEGATQPVPLPTAGALRQRRYRDRRAERDSDVTGDATRDATASDASPLSLPPPPQTPPPPTHTPRSVSTREREDAAFGRFWAAYPRKVGKADARKAFAKAWRKLPPMEEEPILTGGLERAKAAWVDAQFIPHAATWLNGERWQDEPEPIIPLKPRLIHDRPDRPSPDAKFAARQANLAAHERGADLAARLYRESG